MANCALALELDEAKPVYLPGELVRGTVEVTVFDAVACKSLQVGLRWRAHGKGNPAHEEIARASLFAGEWSAGTTWTERFELALPAGPYTYHGQTLNVVWEVFARADIPLARDPEIAAEIALRPDPDRAPDFRAAVGSTAHLPSKLEKTVRKGLAAPAKPTGLAARAASVGCLLLFLLPAIAIAAGFLGVGVWSSVQLASGDTRALGAVLMFVLVVLAFAGRPVFRSVRARLARARIGAVALRIEPAHVRAGNAIDVRVTCTPRRATELRAATARIVATEVVTRGAGKHATISRQIVHEDEFELAPARTLPPGVPFEAGTSIPIPAGAPPSFYAWENKLSWTVEVRLDVAGWPDWREETEILVHP